MCRWSSKVIHTLLADHFAILFKVKLDVNICNKPDVCNRNLIRVVDGDNVN